MKRYTAILLAAALLFAATLAGCGGREAQPPVQDAGGSSVPEEAESSVPSEGLVSAYLTPSAPVQSSPQPSASTDSQETTDQSGAQSDPSEIKIAYQEYQTAREKTGALVRYEFSQSMILLLSNEPDAEVDLEKTSVTARGGVSVASAGSAYEYSRISSYKDAHRSSIGSAEVRCYGDGNQTVRLEAYTDPVNAANSTFFKNTSAFREETLSAWMESAFSYEAGQVRSFTRTESGGNQYYKFLFDPEKTRELVRAEFQSADPEITVSAAEVSYFVVSAAIDANGYLISEELSVICRVTEDGVPNRYEFTSALTLGGYGRAELISAPSWLNRTSAG